MNLRETLTEDTYRDGSAPGMGVAGAPAFGPLSLVAVNPALQLTGHPKRT